MISGKINVICLHEKKICLKKKKKKPRLNDEIPVSPAGSEHMVSVGAGVVVEDLSFGRRGGFVSSTLLLLPCICRLFPKLLKLSGIYSCE